MVMGAIEKFVRKLGIMLRASLDDWLLRNRSQTVLVQQPQELLSLLEGLGMLVNF